MIMPRFEHPKYSHIVIHSFMMSLHFLFTALQSRTGEKMEKQGIPCSFNRISLMKTGYSLWEFEFREFLFSLQYTEVGFVGFLSSEFKTMAVKIHCKGNWQNLTPHRGAFSQFLFQLIHYFHSSKSTRKENGKTNLRALCGVLQWTINVWMSQKNPLIL